MKEQDLNKSRLVQVVLGTNIYLYHMKQYMRYIIHYNLSLYVCVYFHRSKVCGGNEVTTFYKMSLTSLYAAASTTERKRQSKFSTSKEHSFYII